jgi:hypothetical protein
MEISFGSGTCPSTSPLRIYVLSHKQMWSHIIYEMAFLLVFFFPVLEIVPFQWLVRYIDFCMHADVLFYV